MTLITSLVIKLFTIILETIGTIATYTPCASYFDEPEVPDELTKIND